MGYIGFKSSKKHENNIGCEISEHTTESVTCQSLCDEYSNALKLDKATYNGGEVAWTKNVAQKKRVIDHNGCNLVCGGGNRVIGSIIVLLISLIVKF